MKDRKIKLCCLGLGGNSMEYGGGCHGSWYLHSPEEIAKHYASELEAGVMLLDKRPALEKTSAYAYASPLVNVDADPGTVDDFTSRYLGERSLVMDAMRQYGQTAAIIQAAEIAAEHEVKPGPLDYVDTLTYCRWWVDRGAVLYRYDGAAFVLALEVG